MTANILQGLDEPLLPASFDSIPFHSATCTCCGSNCVYRQVAKTAYPEWWVGAVGSNVSGRFEEETKMLIERYRALYAEKTPDWWLLMRRHTCYPLYLTETRNGVQWWSVAGQWFLLMRLLMIFSTTEYILHIFTEKDSSSKFSTRTIDFILPSLALSHLTALAATWSYLPQKFDELSSILESPPTQSASIVTAPISSVDIRNAAWLSNTFMACQAIAVLIMIIGTVFSEDPNYFFQEPSSTSLGVLGNIPWIITFVATIFGNAPTLSAFLFTLSLDIARARKHLGWLAESAKNKSLSVVEYRESREYIRRINRDWVYFLYALGGVAVYNTIGLAVFLVGNSRTTNDSTVEKTAIYDFFWIAVTLKEAVLLLIFTDLARRVNDEADEVVADVFQWIDEKNEEDQEEGSRNAALRSRRRESLSELDQIKERLEDLERKNQRLEIVAEGANFSFLSVPRDHVNRETFWRRFLAINTYGGIQFKVLGVRWTSQYVNALGVSYLITVFYAVFQMVLGMASM